MRITNRMMINQAIQHMADNLDKVNQASERIATGKQFQTFSDDPVSASLSMNLRSTLKTTDGYKTTALLANDWMSATDFAMQQMEELGNRAVNLVQRGLNDSLGSTERLNALSTEIDAILTNAVEVANSSHNGQYLFAGYQTSTKPFAYDPLVPNIVDYDGDSQIMMRTLGPGQSIAMNVPGDAVYPDFFAALIDARNALAANDTTTLRTTLTELQSSVDLIGQKRTANGARQRQVETAAGYMEKAELEVKSLLAQKEETNLAEAIANLRMQETTYQSVLEVSQRAISALNLFEYMR